MGQKILKYLTRVFAGIGVLFVLSTIVTLVMISQLASRFGPPPLPEAMVLRLEIDGPFPETVQPNPLALLSGEPPVPLHGIVRALDAAATDDRVKAMLVRFRQNQITPAQAQELRAAVKRFRQSGKPAYAFAYSFGEMTNAIYNYHLATAFDEIWLQPQGIVGLLGIASEQPFLAGALADAGIGTSFVRREDYKTAADNLTESGFTEANREQTIRLLTDLTDQLVEDIAADRALSIGAVRALIDRAPIGDQEAVEAGLIDRLLYGDEVTERLDAETDEASWVSLARYGAGALGGGTPFPVPLSAPPSGPPGAAAPAIALIHAVGPLVLSAEGGPDALTGGSAMDVLRVSLAIREAAEDERVKAIILRVESPGGSVAASETVRRAVQAAQQNQGKPVIVSMGGVAASGGYWISMNADRIVAQPATLTGSIGVIGGKPNIAALSDRLDINWERIVTGQNAGMLSIARDFTDSERAALTRFIDRAYQTFLEGVAEGREMSLEEVRTVAGGRVWTGRQALEAGLVDALGGIDTAMALAKELAGLAEDAEPDLIILPRPLPPWEQLGESLPFFGSMVRNLALVSAALAPAAQTLAPLTQGAGARMHPIDLR